MGFVPPPPPHPDPEQDRRNLDAWSRQNEIPQMIFGVTCLIMAFVALGMLLIEVLQRAD